MIGGVSAIGANQPRIQEGTGMARMTTAQQPHLFAPSLGHRALIPFVPPSRAWTLVFFSFPKEIERRGCPVDGGEVVEDGITLCDGAGRLAGNKACAQAAGGGVSALLPAPLIKLGLCRRKHMLTHKNMRDNRERSDREGSKVCRVFCSANAKRRPARRRRAGRNRRRRRIKNKANHAQAALFS